VIFIKGNVHNFLNGCDKKSTKDFKSFQDEKSFFKVENKRIFEKGVLEVN
jgi:hypothetical protein